MAMFALRGATDVESNDAEAILGATTELMNEIMRRNGLRPEQVISCVFTATQDLDAEFPAVAARKMGLSGVPLLCAREIPVPGALPKVIRVLIHAYKPNGQPPEHVYLGETRSLRADLHAAQ